MSDSLIMQYSQEELQQIIALSKSYKDLAKKLGYNSFSGDLKKFLEKKCNGFNTSHFEAVFTERTKRTEENVFCEDSTADQKTLRKWYKEKKYTDYKCSICGQQPFWNGKDLTLILDHINGHNKDNRLENLRWVCPNCNQQLDTTNGKNKQIHHKKYYCSNCGAEVTKKGCLCRDCYIKSKTISLDDMPVTREELKQLIRTKPFTQIGKDFDVSDNAIRKWCDKFNLPRKKSDINKMTDLQWSKI